LILQAKGYTVTEDSLHINSSVAQLAPHTVTSAASTLFDLARENGMTVPASTQSQDAGLFLPLDDSNYPLHDFDYLALSTQADTTQAGTNWGDTNFTASIHAFENSFGSYELEYPQPE
jgi:hypothetical protein